MRNKFMLSALLCGGIAVAAVGAADAKPHFPKFFGRHTGESAQTKQQAVKSKVTMEQAQAAALKKVPGTVADSRMQTVKGKEVYWFQVEDKNGRQSQIWVSSTSGKVTKVEKEKAMKTAKSKT